MESAEDEIYLLVTRESVRTSSRIKIPNVRIKGIC
jgi:hypothetical protein